MLPLVARATIEVLALVPNHLREASYALGVSKWHTVLGVVLPTSLGGILTGTTLAIARAAGEPRRSSSHARSRARRRLEPDAFGELDPAHDLPVLRGARTRISRQAWALAFVLIAFVLVASLTARFLYERSRRKLGGALTFYRARVHDSVTR